jgi:uncharacterized cupredoxin-like copper-binding protein
MKRALVIAAGVWLSCMPVQAAGNHDGGHGHSEEAGHGAAAFGMPGKTGEVSRTIDVRMAETDDGAMVFEPSEIKVSKGETVKFALRNAGELPHEFVLGDKARIQAHKKMMEMAAESGHDHGHDSGHGHGHGHGGGNSLQLEAGQTGDLVWRFSGGGHFEFACLIPGHYEAGMKGKLQVGGH